MRPDHPVDESTIDSAVAIAGQAALAIDNARLYQQQKDFADAMQRSLLPQVRPAVEGLDVGEVYAASARVEVGGDLYDYMALADGRLAVVLGDVTGHGIDAAADMAMAKFVFRSLAREHPEPGDFLAAANEVVVGEIAAGKFITMLYLLIDAATGVVSVASAGHPPPRLVTADGSVGGIEARGLALGVDSGVEYEETRAQLEPGGVRRPVYGRRDRGEARCGALRPGPARRAARAPPRAARGGHRGLGDPVGAPVHRRRASRRLRGRRAEAPGVNARRSLYTLVFLAGVGTLATEICASRLLAPYYGSSTIVWANIIGLTLASLSLGYWLGGRVADRNPSPQLLGRLVLAAAVLVAVIPFVSSPILDVASSGLDEVSAGAVIGSFFGTLLLFAPPIVLLGMVAPFAIRLALVEVASAGQVAGRLYALSTVGSLLGTFVTALITIPLIGTQRTLLVAAALLAAAASTMLGRRWLVATAAIVALMLVPPGAVKASDGECSTRSSRRTSSCRSSSATGRAGST